MAIIKIKDIEGEAEDIQRLFHDEGRDITDYLGVDRTSRRLSKWWIVGVAALFFILSCCICAKNIPGGWNTAAILGEIMIPFVIIGMIHYKHRNWVITMIAIIACVAMASVAFHVNSPQGLIQHIEELIIKLIGGK